MADQTRSPRRSSVLTDRRIEVLIAVALLLIAGPMMHKYLAAPASRYLLTVAIVEDGTIFLDDYEEHLFIDKAVVDGRVLSDKAPYQSMIGVPFFAVYRVAGGDAFPATAAEDPTTPTPMIGLWWLTLWTSLVPAFVLFLLMRRIVTRVYPKVSTRTAVALLFGTILLPFAAMLFGHVLSATLLFAGWYVMRDSQRQRDLVWAGLLIALGVGTEYPVAVCAVVLFGAAVARHRAQAAFLVLGGVIGAVPLMLYHTAAFGGPFQTAYQGHLPNFQGDGALGVYNLQWPDSYEIMRALVGDRGLFVLTPILLVALVGAFVAIRERTGVRRDSILAMVMLVGLLAVSTGIDGIGGASPGPRYLIPIIPFMALPLAEAWRRFGTMAAVAAILGATFMLMATITDPMVETDDPVGPTEWVDELIAGELGPNLPQHLGAGALLPVFTVAGLFVLAAALHLDRRAAAESVPTGAG